MYLKDLRKQLDSKEISVLELTELYLDKIKKNDNKINSYITVSEKSAINDAKNAQKLIDEGKSLSLTGIPLSVKDNISTKGTKTTCASKMLSDYIPSYDATVIKKIKEQNGVILGKVNMDEFAMGSTNSSSYFGEVKNPINNIYSPGGSSGGSAAAVKAGLCAFSLGTDTGGSVRQPAAFCDLSGLKPTYGSVSRYGLIAYASSLDQVGIIANSSEDTGYVLNTICGFDENDMTTSRHIHTDYLSQLGRSIKGIKIGVVKEFMNVCEDEVSSAIYNALDYYKKLGAEIVELNIKSIPHSVSAYYIISSVEATSNLARFDGIRFGYREKNANSYNELVINSRTKGFGEGVKRRIILGNYYTDGENYEKYYKKSLTLKEQLKYEFQNSFSICDVILAPTSPIKVPVLSEIKKDIKKSFLSDICTVGINLAGLPALNTTCAYDKNSMPIGMSFIAKPFDEATIIALADRYEKDFIKH